MKKQMSQTTLAGLIVPILTPFSDSGAIDEAAFVEHIAFLEHHGVRNIMVNGTTAEFFSLLPAERKRLLELARKHFRGTIILHVGGLGLAQNKVELQWANDLGADAMAALPPIYPAGLSAEGIIDYFMALESVAQIPLILYNFPKHTGNAITPEILRAVPHFALKDSSQNLALIEHTPRYFVGSSSILYDPIQQGAAGFVSATANVRPALYTAFEKLLASGEVQEAVMIQNEVRAYSSPFSRGGIPALKKALSKQLPNYPQHVRLPLKEWADG